jgi:hypothetical protein
MVWPATLPRIGAVVVALVLVAAQTWMPRFSSAGVVAEKE